MESNNSTYLSGSIVVDSNFTSEFDNSNSENGVNPSKTIDSSIRSICSSDDDDEGFVSGGEDFETASEKPIAASETPEDGVVEEDDDVAAPPASVKTTMAIVAKEREEDEEEEVVEREAAIEPVSVLGEIGDETSGVRVLGGGEVVEREEDTIEPVMEFGEIEPVPESCEIGEETSEVRVLNGGEVVKREDAIEPVPELGKIENETKLVEREADIEPVSKSGETSGVRVSSGGEVTVNDVGGSESGSVETEPVSIQVSDLGVVGTGLGSIESVAEPVMSETIEVFSESDGEKESEITKSDANEGLVEILKYENPKIGVEAREISLEDMETALVDEKHEVEVLEHENLQADEENSEEITNAVEIKEMELVNNNGSIQANKSDDDDDDDENFDELVNGFNETINVLEKTSNYPEENENNIQFPTQENADSDDEQTDGVVFGSSQAARQFMEDLEREQQASGSHEIDGQIATDDSEEEEEGESDGEDEKEVFDAAAFAALLKAATRGGDDGGNITINSQDGSRLFSIERPAGLGSSNRVAQPMGRVNRSALFAPPSVGVEKELSEEEKKKLESLQNLRVKFLRLVRRLGASPEDSVAAQVLYRLAIIAGRPNHQAFSFDEAKTTALELEAEGKDDLDFSINILVLGKCGVGKSSTINSIFGEEKAKVGSFEPGTSSVREISGIVDGVKIKVIDTPGLKSSMMEQSFNRKILSSVKSFMKKSPPDVVLYIDRLDTQTRDLNDLPLLKTITAALGQPIWRSAVVALSHAASAPPDGPNGNPLNYEVSVTQRSHVVQQLIGHAVGDLRMMSPSLMNPVTLVENHHLCRKNRDGHKVLPNGQTWRPQLLLLSYSMKILALANSISKPHDPFDHRKLFGFRVRSPPLPYLLSSMLQSRAHPKLPSDQGMDNGDSDVDMADFSDSDNEEEEDEYDQLPPFKPLRKKQIEKLSKEQRKAYFEEYDYRVKLLRKKQWRDEAKRVKEMKRREKGGGGGGPEYGFDEADQEQDGPAPVATPLPDMAMPPTFDSDNPTYRYRFLEPTSQFLARPVLDSHSWDHDCGYDGVSMEQTLAIASKFPAAVSLQMTKDKKDFTIHLDSSVAAKYGESGSAMAGFDIQQIGKQLGYIIRGETKFKNLKKNKTAAGVTVTFLGENIAMGIKIEDQIAIGKQWAMVGSAGTVRCQGDAAYGANLEVQRRERDYPIGQVQSTYGLSLLKFRGDWALGLNSVAQFAIGRNSKVAIRAGINNKLSGQITARTSSSDHLSLVLVGIIPIASAIYKKIWPAAGDNYSIY